jgi:hypothetical protein
VTTTTVNPLNPRQAYLPDDRIRLEVETKPTDPDTLVNLCLNPSGDLGAWGWGYDPTLGGGELDSGPIVSDGSAWALRFRQASATQVGFLISYYVPIEPGQWANGHYSIFATDAPVRASWRFYTADRTEILPRLPASLATTTRGTHYAPAQQAPAGAAYARLVLSLFANTATLTTPAPIDSEIRVRTIMIAALDAPAADLPYVEPRAWHDIASAANSIQINRATLDASTLTAVVVDPALDPADDPADVIAVGRMIRCSALVDIPTGLPGGEVIQEWRELYTGIITDAKTTYLTIDGFGALRPSIEIQAVDAASTLASMKAAEGYDYLGGLTLALAGTNVPYIVNGATGPVTVGGSACSRNDDASVLDQVAIARDTVHGLAWIDRRGRLQAWDIDNLPAGPVASYSANTGPEGTQHYSVIDASWSPTSVINVVTVNYLRYDAVAATAETIVYGPYLNQASIDAYGARAATFTIQGLIETGAEMAAYAQRVLDRNATPARLVNSITVPVNDVADILYAAGVDLCSLVDVNHDDLIDAAHRVNGIQHTITPDGWLVTYTFAPPESVAAPQVTPPPVSASTVVATKYLEAVATGAVTLANATPVGIPGHTQTFNVGGPGDVFLATVTIDFTQTTASSATAVGYMEVRLADDTTVVTTSGQVLMRSNASHGDGYSDRQTPSTSMVITGLDAGTYVLRTYAYINLASGSYSAGGQWTRRTLVKVT